MNTARSTESAAQGTADQLQEPRQMQAVMVQYKVRPDFVEENKANISKIMVALRENAIKGLKYVTFTKEDGQTFVHLNIAKDEEALAQFSEMAEFKAFQAALRENRPLKPPSPKP
jgi:quinol monooxygenase YgiN